MRQASHHRASHRRALGGVVRPLRLTLVLLDVSQFLHPIRLGALACSLAALLPGVVELGLGSLCRRLLGRANSCFVLAFRRFDLALPLGCQLVGLLLRRSSPLPGGLRRFLLALLGSAPCLFGLALSRRACFVLLVDRLVARGLQLSVDLLLACGRLRVKLGRTRQGTKSESDAGFGPVINTT